MKQMKYNPKEGVYDVWLDWEQPTPGLFLKSVVDPDHVLDTEWEIWWQGKQQNLAVQCSAQEDGGGCLYYINVYGKDEEGLFSECLNDEEPYYALPIALAELINLWNHCHKQGEDQTMP